MAAKSESEEKVDINDPKTDSCGRNGQEPIKVGKNRSAVETVVDTKTERVTEFADDEIIIHIKKKSKNIDKEKKSENIDQEKKSENIDQEKKSENIDQEKKSENIDQEKKTENIDQEKKSENIDQEKKSENINQEKKSENIDQEKKSENIDQVWRFISAFMNSDGGVIRLKNKSYLNANPGNLDIWFGKVEKGLFQSSSKFYKFGENPNTEKPKCQIENLELIVQPLTDRICTIDSHLYLPRITDVRPVDGLEAFEILNSTDCSYTISQIPRITGTFEYGKQHPVAKEESDQVQLKEIKCKKENIPNKFSEMVVKYISAFCNHKGGRILFGFKDGSCQVVGVQLSEKDKDSIKQIMLNIMENKMQYGCEVMKPKKGEHWDIEFFEVKHSSKVEVSKDRTLEVIVVSVSKFPGGVFTAPPKAYYVDDSRQIKQYSVVQWKHEIMKIHRDMKEDIKEMKSDIKEDMKAMKSDVKDMKEDMHEMKSYFGQTTGCAASDSSGNNQLSIRQGTDLIPDHIDDSLHDSIHDKVLTNVFEHHVTSEYQETENFMKLEEILRRKNCVTIQGYLGTGKSTLALKKCINMIRGNNLVWKFDCPDTEALHKSMAILCKEIKCKVMDTGYMNEDILVMGRAVFKKDFGFCSKSHLFLFDNVTEVTKKVTKTLVETYLPETQDIQIIVTSTLSVVGEVLHVEGFKKAESMTFLLNIEGSDEEKHNLGDIYSYNPLGLSIARQYISECHVSIKEYLRILIEETGGEAVIEASSAVTVDKLLFNSIFYIFGQICKSCPVVFQKMLLLQYFDHEEIPVILLQKAISFLAPNAGNFEAKDVNDVLTTMKSHAFATVTGKDEKRVFRTYGAILLAIKKFATKDLEIEFKQIEMTKALLWSVMCMMNKDNRMKLDFEKNYSLLPHAESILNHALNVLRSDIVRRKLVMEDSWFSLPLLYVADIVGYTYDFYEMHHFGAKYCSVAKDCFWDLICDEEEGRFNEITSEDIAKKLHCKMSSIIAKNEAVLNKMGKEFVLNKYRSAGDIEIINCKLPANHQIKGSYLQEADYNALSSRNHAVPEEKLGKYFFFEVLISFLYSYGRRIFYTSEKVEEPRYRHYLLVAYHLSNKFAQEETKWKILHQMLTKRNGQIQEALRRKLNLDQTKEIAVQCLLGLNDDSTYFHYGVFHLDAKSDGYCQAAWLKQLVKCYKLMLNQTTEEDKLEKREMKEASKEDKGRRDTFISQGMALADMLSAKIQSLKHTSAYPGFLLVVGTFYQCIENLESAKMCYKEVQDMQRDKLRKHGRLASIYYLHCQLLESRLPYSSTSPDDIQDLVSRTSRITLPLKNERNELEQILFGKDLQTSGIQQKACIDYLKVLLSYLGNKHLDIDNECLETEISELVQKFESFNLSGYDEDLKEIKSTLNVFKMEGKH